MCSTEAADRVARCPKWAAANIATVGGQIRPIIQNAKKLPNFDQLCAATV